MNKKCPSCKAKLGEKIFARYEQDRFIRCPSCARILVVPLYVRLINSVLIGVATGVILSIFTPASIGIVMAASFIVGMVGQSFVDILFELKVYDGDDPI